MTHMLPAFGQTTVQPSNCDASTVYSIEKHRGGGHHAVLTLRGVLRPLGSTRAEEGESWPPGLTGRGVIQFEEATG